MSESFGIAVRPLAAAEIPVAAALHAAGFADEPWSPAAVTEVLAMPGAFGLLACGPEEATPSGLLLALALASECEILALAVHPERRRRGVARALLAAALARAGQRRIVLDVAEDNDAALALYRSAGFAVVGRRAAYYRRRAAASAAALILAREAGW